MGTGVGVGVGPGVGGVGGVGIGSWRRLEGRLTRRELELELLGGGGPLELFEEGGGGGGVTHRDLIQEVTHGGPFIGLYIVHGQ